jgi:cytochrome P450
MIPLFFLAGFVLFSVFKLVSSTIEKRRINAESLRLGCKPAKVAANRLPLGIDLIQRYLKADVDNCLPDLLIERTIEQGTQTFKNNVLGSEQIFTTEPKNLQAMLATQFSDFSLGAVRRGNFFPLLGNGIFTQDGKAWEHSRGMMRPQFAREQIQDLGLEETHVQNMMQAIQTDPKNGWTGTIDLQTLFFRLTLDSATDFLFGESADSQLAELPENKSKRKGKATSRDEIMFANAFDTSQKALATRLRFADKYWVYNTAEFRSANKICHDFIDHYVTIALRGKPTGKKEQTPGVKEKYVFLEQLAKETRDPIELRSQLLNLLLAGRDTTASLLGWLFYLLARDQTQWNMLRSAILDDFGTYKNPSNLTFERIKGCQYLQHTMNEVLRLFPIVPLNIRFATKDTTLPLGGGADGKSPIFVKKGQEVQYSVHVMQRRKDLWGDDADEFKPERWMGRKIDWSYLPFNGGPRICIGQQFALTEASYVAIRLMQRFDEIENMLPEERPRHNFTLTNCSASGCVVRLHEATS